MRFLLLDRINGSLLFISAFSLETKHAVHQCKQRIISALADIDAGMDLSAPLSVQDISRLNELSVSSLRT